MLIMTLNDDGGVNVATCVSSCGILMITESSSLQNVAELASHL